MRTHTITDGLTVRAGGAAFNIYWAVESYGDSRTKEGSGTDAQYNGRGEARRTQAAPLVLSE